MAAGGGAPLPGLSPVRGQSAGTAASARVTLALPGPASPGARPAAQNAASEPGAGPMPSARQRRREAAGGALRKRELGTETLCYPRRDEFLCIYFLRHWNDLGLSWHRAGKIIQLLPSLPEALVFGQPKARGFSTRLCPGGLWSCPRCGAVLAGAPWSLPSPSPGTRREPCPKWLWHLGRDVAAAPEQLEEKTSQQRQIAVEARVVFGAGSAESCICLCCHSLGTAWEKGLGDFWCPSEKNTNSALQPDRPLHPELSTHPQSSQQGRDKRIPVG
ncbi:uncharacterized protein LOC131084070 [Melospiza georgiana]|uniref:uncharacterized protein LOC131084070 n=1 Tax=Melospiza georgiana TaxID=44398 RepID=UPI0025AB622F|nr:uncharacterized protein LOC131084070 [Melospiza georgiana]